MTMKQITFLCLFMGLVQRGTTKTNKQDLALFCDDNGTEYKFFTKHISHQNASDVCGLFGGKLASLESSEKIKFIRKKIKSFGLNQAVVGVRHTKWGQLQHMDGSALNKEVKKHVEPYHVIFASNLLHEMSVALKLSEDSGHGRGFLCQRKSGNGSSVCVKTIAREKTPSSLTRKTTSDLGRNPEPGKRRNATKTVKLFQIFTPEQIETQKQIVLESFERHFSTFLPRNRNSTPPKQHLQMLAKRDTTLGIGNNSEVVTQNQNQSSTDNANDEIATFGPRFNASDETNYLHQDADTNDSNGNNANGFDEDSATVGFATNKFRSEYSDQPDTGGSQTNSHVFRQTTNTFNQSSTNNQSTIKLKSPPPPPPNYLNIPAIVKQVNLHQTLPQASELLNNISSVLEEPVDGDSPDVQPITPEDLLDIGESLLPKLAPVYVRKPPLDFSDSVEDSAAEDDEITQYALSFMRITSNLLNPINTESWKQTILTQNKSRQDALTPSSLMEQMDTVLEYSVLSLTQKSRQNFAYSSDVIDVKVEYMERRRDVLVEVQADGSLSPQTTLRRKERSLSKNQTEDELLTIVTANYKSAARILETCVDVSTASLRQEPADLSDVDNTGNACARNGILVTDSLCEHMFDNMTSPPKAVWSFPTSSNVLSITAFDGERKQNIPVKFHIRETEKHPNVTNHVTKCVYYDTNELLWSDFGCSLVTQSGDGNYSCRCNHTTNFAILLLVPITQETFTSSVDNHAVSPSNELCGTTLQMVSYIVGGFSIAFLGVSVAFFAYARQRSERTVERNTVHMCLALSMLCLHIVLLADRSNQATLPQGRATEDDANWFCYVITAFTHFFLLCNFAWMTVEGILLYVLVVLGNKRLGKLKHVIGWGVPMTTAGVTFGVAMATKIPYVRQTDLTDQPNSTSQISQSNDAGNGYVCYLSNQLVWAAFVPVLVSILLNFVIAIRLVAVISRLTKESRLYRPSGQRGTPAQINARALRKSLAAFLKLNPLLGFPWIVGFVASFVPQPYQCYVIFVHTCINGTQGAFFFFVTVVENEESRSLIRLTWRKLRHNTSSFVTSMRQRRSMSYPVGTPSHNPTSLTPPSGRHRTVNTPVLGGKELQAIAVVNCNTVPDNDAQFL